MGYIHIDNLYKYKEILKFKECYALEKIHGTSAHLSFISGTMTIFAGGMKHTLFEAIFDKEKLLKYHVENFDNDVKIYGEAYGGKCQGMSGTYGKDLKFVVFDVKIGDWWLNVPDAEDVAKKFGLEFVAYKKISTELKDIDAERDADSIQAIRNGMGEGKKREGVVLKPLIEVSQNNGKRLMCKHKRDEFRETKTPRIVSDKELKVYAEAQKIAREWVTPMRLTHVLDKLDIVETIDKTGLVIKAMIEDIYREGKNEIVESKEATKQIGKATAIMFKKKITKVE